MINLFLNEGITMLDRGIVVNSSKQLRDSIISEIKIRHIEPQFAIILEQLDRVSNKEEKFRIVQELINLIIQPNNEILNDKFKKACNEILVNTPCNAKEKEYIYRALMVLLKEYRFNESGVSNEWTLQDRLQRNGHICTEDEIEEYFFEVVQLVYAEKYDTEQSEQESEESRGAKRKCESMDASKSEQAQESTPVQSSSGSASSSTSGTTPEFERSVRPRIGGESMPGNVPNYEITSRVFTELCQSEVR